MKVRPEAPTSEVVSAAIAASHLRDVPRGILVELTRNSRQVSIAAGETIHQAGESQPHFELVLAGLVRVYITAPDGRSMTVRYCQRGGLVGTATLFAPRAARPFGIQALSDSGLLILEPHAVRELSEREPAVAAALLAETSERVLAFVSELSRNAFAPVRERVAAHLLSLASDNQNGSLLMAPVTQQALADAVGSVREVVVRVLRELREEGAIATGRGGIIIVQPERLLEVFGT